MHKHHALGLNALFEEERKTGLFAGEEAIPLQGVSMAIDILDMASRITLRQRFKNTFDEAMEATYCFPIPPNAAVNGFNTNIGGKKIKGVVKSRDEAFKDYDQAMEEGNGAFLLDQEKEDIFVTSVGNLKPGEEAEIEISSISRLDVYGQKVRLMIPVTISPRYAPAHSDPVKVDRISPPAGFQVPYGLTIEVRIRNGEDIGRVSSPSHKTEIRKDGNDLVVTLHQSESALDRDFILEFEAERYAQPRAVISRHANGDHAVMVNWIPSLPHSSERSKEGIVFILDCSGSMDGSSIKEAKAAIAHCVQRLEAETSFNIIFFGSEHTALFEQMVPCTEETRAQALSRINETSANMGGTEIMPALEAAYAMAGKQLTNIFLITDGEVFNLEEAITLARRNRERARVFSFGIGYGPSHAFIEGIAKASGGGAVFISPDESIEEKVVRQFNRFSTPEVKDIEIDWGSLAVTDLPNPIPPVFFGEPFVVFGRLEKAPEKMGEVTFKGTVGGKTVTFTAPLFDLGEDDLIPTLWAKQRIQELEIERTIPRGSRQVERKAEGIRKQIQNLALKYQLMSSETSFVAILERNDEEKSLETPIYTRVPIQLTRDWGGMGYAAKNVSFHQEPIVLRHYALSESASYMAHPARPKRPQRVITPEEKKRVKFYNALYKCHRETGEFEWDEGFLAYYGFPVTKLERLTESMEGVTEEMRKTVLMTVIAVILLEKMTAIKGKRLTLIQKATKWLKTNAANAQVQGKPLREVVEALLDLEKTMKV